MENGAQIELLKQELAIELAKENSNISNLLRISNAIASLDEDNIRFSIDAGLVDRLGQELVARQETAVSELVKNSHDADATSVILTFIDSDYIGGTLKIQDDGDGMTRDELVNGFMRISSTNKVHNPTSPKYGRKRAGQKGIGRFAVQRLGEKLTIITQTEEADSSLMLSINWNDYKNDIDLSTVFNTLKVIPKHKEKGTTLIIEGLRERWSEAAIQRIYGYVADIIQPFSLKPKKTDESIIVDPGFKFEFIKIADGKAKTVSNSVTDFYNHAVASVEGIIDEIGNGLYTVSSKKLDISETRLIGKDPLDETTRFDKLRNLRFKAFYFIYEPDLLPKSQLTSIRKLAETHGGIRLYRNGFRVLPYGEPNNDWLKLDRSLRTRTILPSHGNNNFFGFVELEDASNKFNETSSREGLVENDAFIELQNFVYRAIMSGVVKVAQVRGKKIVTNQKKDTKGKWETIELSIQNVTHTLEELDRAMDETSSKPNLRVKRKRAITQLKEEIAQISVLHKAEQTNSLKEKSMLRVLSSVGLTIAQFIHEVKYYMDNIRSDIKFLLERLDGQKELLDRVVILDSNFSTFHSYTSYFDNVVSQNVIRDLRPLDLRRIVDPFIESIHKDAAKSGIEMLSEIRGYRLFTVPMHPSEWSSILFNFYTNSKKAIFRSKNDGKILIECGANDEIVYLEFSDTGDGIPKEIEERIFDEFFTTTSPNALENIQVHYEILGTGLGLKIVNDIVDSYKGRVFVASAKGEYSTCIRIEIPKATEKDIIKYGA